MFEEKEVKNLARLRSERGDLVSLYLDIDQSRADSDRIKIEIKDLLKQIEGGVPEKLLGQITKEATRLYREREKGLAIFASDQLDVWEAFPTAYPFANQIFLGERAIIRPLLKLMDEAERFCVVQVDKKKARILLVYLGEVEDRTGLVEKYFPGHHKQGGWSMARFQRHVENEAMAHVKEVARRVYKKWKRHEFNRLIIGGSPQALAYLKENLHPDLKIRVAGEINKELFLDDQEVLQAAMKIEEKIEREKEKQLISELMDSLGEGNTGVTGIDKVARAIRDRRVMTLFVKMGKSQPGRKCGDCGRIFVEDVLECPDCGGGSKFVKDAVSRIILEAYDQSARVEFYKDDNRLADQGDIGAIIRY